ncbi:MAG: TonB-dependent receptor, partial [Flavobacteriales bacterium]
MKLLGLKGDANAFARERTNAAMVAKHRSNKGHLVALLIILHTLPSSAQSPTSSLRGQIVDAFTSDAIPSATISLLPAGPTLRTTSDSSGAFILRDVPVGQYSLRVAMAGYDTLDVPEIWMRSGKESEQRVELTPTNNLLGSVTVSAMGREELSPLGIHTFTVEQSLRWPATFQDPSRLVAAFPGVTQVDDGTNHLSIRGNSPNSTAYTLEGAEIVNPSHLTNGGTPTDLPTLSGGGESILSAQVLGTSQLLDGVLPTSKDNALGGILDMHLRDGNTKEQEWTLQAGLLGIEASTEGPLGSGDRSSYLVNYRYSTVGLLGAMGISFGGETTTFQDLSFNVALPIGKRGEAHLFGLGGTSSNVFDAVHDTTQWKVDKDSKDINYTARTGAVGGSVRIPLGGRSTFSSTIALSGTDQRRTEDDLSDDYAVAYHSDIALSERKLSGLAQVDGSLGARFRYSIGGSAMQRQVSTFMDDGLTGWLIRPWLNGRWSFTDRLQASVGLAWSDFTFNNDNVVEPRATLEWRMPHGRKLALAYGISSQLPEWQVTRVDFENLPFSNKDIGLTRSQDVVLGYDDQVNERLSFHAEAYYQTLSNVPVQDHDLVFGEGNNFSMVNVWDEPVQVPLESTGTATNAGVELSVDHHFATNFFYQANTSLFQSQYS